MGFLCLCGDVCGDDENVGADNNCPDNCRASSSADLRKGHESADSGDDAAFASDDRIVFRASIEDIGASA